VHRENRDRNAVICATFRSEKKADVLLEGIHLTDIVMGLQKEYAEAGTLMAAGKILAAAAEEVKAFELDK